MSIGRSFFSGLARVLHSPAIIFWIYLASIAATLPLTAAMRQILKDSIGDSLVHEKLRDGFPMDWYGEFSAQSSGLGSSFGPSVVGILPLLTNLEKLMDGQILRTDGTILLSGTLFLLAWTFLAGGMLACYAGREASYKRSQLFSAGSEYFFRFLKLLILSLLGYLAIFRWVANPLHRLVENATRDVTVEKTVILYTAVAYALVGILLVLVSCAGDYAKIAVIVERRNSSILAFIRGLTFMVSHPVKTLGLYLLLLLTGIVLWLVYAAVAPGAGQSTSTSVTFAFLVGQSFILGRMILKLWFLASQTALFQSAQPPPQSVTATIAPLGGA